MSQKGRAPGPVIQAGPAAHVKGRIWRGPNRKQKRERQRLAEQKALQGQKRPGVDLNPVDAGGHASYGKGKGQCGKTQPRKGVGKTGKPWRDQAKGKGKGKGRGGPDDRLPAHAK